MKRTDIGKCWKYYCKNWYTCGYVLVGLYMKNNEINAEYRKYRIRSFFFYPTYFFRDNILNVMTDLGNVLATSLDTSFIYHQSYILMYFSSKFSVTLGTQIMYTHSPRKSIIDGACTALFIRVYNTRNSRLSTNFKSFNCK